MEENPYQSPRQRGDKQRGPPSPKAAGFGCLIAAATPFSFFALLGVVCAVGSGHLDFLGIALGAGIIAAVLLGLAFSGRKRGG